MANLVQVEIVTPEEVLYEGEAVIVVTRLAGSGEIAFQAGHTPFLAALDSTNTRIELEDGSTVNVATHGGFVEVSNNVVALRCDVAEMGDGVDVSRAQAAKDKAEAAIDAANDEDPELVELKAALKRALARLTAAGQPVA